AALGVVCLVVGAFIDEHKPMISADATFVAKRASVSVWAWNGSGTTRTTNYVTFQGASGTRVELSVPENECGLLVEGDSGTLNMRGDSFHSFARRSHRCAPKRGSYGNV